MITIRRAKLQDKELIWRIHTQAVKEVCKSHYSHDELRAWSEILKPERYEKALRTSVFYVAEKGDLVVGFGELDQEHGRIESLYVGPDWTRQGIGMKILQKLEEAARNSGLSRLHLTSTLNAVEFYENAGYRSQSHLKYLLPPRMVACIQMSKELT